MRRRRKIEGRRLIVGKKLKVGEMWRKKSRKGSEDESQRRKKVRK